MNNDQFRGKCNRRPNSYRKFQGQNNHNHSNGADNMSPEGTHSELPGDGLKVPIQPTQPLQSSSVSHQSSEGHLTSYLDEIEQDRGPGSIDQILSPAERENLLEQDRRIRSIKGILLETINILYKSYRVRNMKFLRLRINDAQTMEELDVARDMLLTIGRFHEVSSPSSIDTSE